MNIFGGLFFIAVAAVMIIWLAGPLMTVIPGVVLLALFIAQAAIGGALIAYHTK